MSKKLWLPEEIRLLVQAYKDRFREKEIAKMLDRTPTSVSKKIDSLRLRTLYGRWLKNISDEGTQKKEQKKGEKKISSVMEDLQQALPVILSPLERMRQKTPEGLDHNGLNWVTFPDVMQWLESIGTLIQRSPLKNAPYLYDGRYLSEAQVLLLCNKVRLERDFPIVHVPNITEVE